MNAVDQALNLAKSETVGLAQAVGAHIAQEVKRHGHGQAFVDERIAHAMGQIRAGFVDNSTPYAFAVEIIELMTDTLAAELRRHGIPFTPPNSTGEKND